MDVDWSDSQADSAGSIPVTRSTRKPKVGGYAERGSALLASVDLRVISSLGLPSRWVPLKAPRVAVLAMAGFVGLGRNCYSAAISFDLTAVLSAECPIQKGGPRPRVSISAHQHSDLHLKVAII